MPSGRKHRRRRRRHRIWGVARLWKKMAAEHGNSFYNTVFFVLLSLIALFLMFYFMGWLESIGLKYEPFHPDRPKP